MKRCPRCGQNKSLDQFYRNRSAANGYSSHCKTCKDAANLAWYAANRANVALRYRRWAAANPDGLWIQELKKTHGLSPEQWTAMLAEQDGLCYLCEQPLPEDRSKVFIDHDHTCCPSGQSCRFCRRGMAHSNCNTAIGLLRDDPAMMRRMADNLERAKEQTAAMLTTAPAQEALFELAGEG